MAARTDHGMQCFLATTEVLYAGTTFGVACSGIRDWRTFTASAAKLIQRLTVADASDVGATG
jgi:hypothetical protein